MCCSTLAKDDISCEWWKRAAQWILYWINHHQTRQICFGHCAIVILLNYFASFIMCWSSGCLIMNHLTNCIWPVWVRFQFIARFRFDDVICFREKITYLWMRRLSGRTMFKFVVAFAVTVCSVLSASFKHTYKSIVPFVCVRQLTYNKNLDNNV